MKLQELKIDELDMIAEGLHVLTNYGYVKGSRAKRIQALALKVNLEKMKILKRGKETLELLDKTTLQACRELVDPPR